MFCCFFCLNFFHFLWLLAMITFCGYTCTDANVSSSKYLGLAFPLLRIILFALSSGTVDSVTDNADYSTERKQMGVNTFNGYSRIENRH